jgi:RNA-directed DNA polymerase
MMNEHGKSDSPIVAAISPNKAVAEEAVEERGLTKGNAIQQNTPRTQSRIKGAPSALGLVREAARKNKRARFTALLHHVTVDRLLQAFLDIRKDAAAGVDGLTWRDYEVQLGKTCRNFIHGSTGERTGQSHRPGHTFPRKMAG